MIQHIVLLKLRPPYSPDEPPLQELERDTNRLQDAIPAIKEMRFGRNVTQRADAHDYALVALFSDEDALASYLDHPAHREVSARWAAVSDRAVADLYEAQSPHEEE
ncbi:Dabb family protein [Streptomyces sp. DSM 40750]|uniref:Dabb family protein n=1 Tax=Streptomyces sp. DSM 40750 TaxID=2801030 RepID=UPI00214C7539|nr:Dabb family protein [Streptomyces sp. DSM 40750]UUU25956.1 Dabb family protein [Streptomyces sp. DSM 40750]